MQVGEIQGINIYMGEIDTFAQAAMTQSGTPIIQLHWLLEEILTSVQIEAVLYHELGHIKLGHLEDDTPKWLKNWMIPSNWIGTVVAVIVTAYVMHRRRMNELEADAYCPDDLKPHLASALIALDESVDQGPRALLRQKMAYHIVDKEHPSTRMRVYKLTNNGGK